MGLPQLPAIISAIFICVFIFLFTYWMIILAKRNMMPAISAVIFVTIGQIHFLIVLYLLFERYITDSVITIYVPRILIASGIATVPSIIHLVYKWNEEKKGSL